MTLNRRDFVRVSSSIAAGAVLSIPALKLDAAATAKESATTGRGRIFKAVKWGMIGTGGSILDKFQLQKELGYDGMELVSPWRGDIDEVRRASEQTEMP